MTALYLSTVFTTLRDEMLQMNDESVENYTHAEVVDAVRNSGNKVRFLVFNNHNDTAVDFSSPTQLTVGMCN